MKVKSILLITAALIYSCETNPPSVPEIIQEYGQVFVSSNIEGAEIFIDEINSGRITPDTVRAETGEHIIRLEKENFYPASSTVIFSKDSTKNVNIQMEEIAVQKVVLLEDFANVSCDPCVVTNLIIHGLVNTTYGTDKLLAIKYPTNFPGAQDPFYSANASDCDSRIQYYSVFFAPTAVIDGEKQTQTTDSTDFINKIDDQLAEVPQFKVEVTDSIFGSTYFISVRVETLSSQDLDFPNLVLHTVVTETDIEFTDPPGSNGETKFYDVMRAMLPSNQGEPLSQNNTSVPVDYERQVEISPAWEINNINTICFVQDKTTKVVYQAGSTFGK